MTDPLTILAWLIVVVILFALGAVIVAGVFILRAHRRMNQRIAEHRAAIRGFRR